MCTVCELDMGLHLRVRISTECCTPLLELFLPMAVQQHCAGQSMHDMSGMGLTLKCLRLEVCPTNHKVLLPCIWNAWCCAPQEELMTAPPTMIAASPVDSLHA